MSGFNTHNHKACVASALTIAKVRCETEKLKLTPVRLRVLEILLEEHRALGAYDILAKLDADGMGSQPPIVYRALDFLVSNGLVHKIQKLNAFIACCESDKDHSPAFMICRCCEIVLEQNDLTNNGLTAAAQRAGFTIESATIEVEGVCPSCTGHDTKCA